MTGTWASGWATGDIVTAAEFKKTAGSIFDTTLGGAAANVDIAGISATYAHLLVTVYARGDAASLATTMLMYFNGDTTTNYDFQQMFGSATSAVAAEVFAGNALGVGTIPAATAGANLFGAAEIFIPHYAGASNNKQFVSITTNKDAATTGNIGVGMFGGGWRSAAAINRVTLIPTSGNFAAGTRVTVHALGA